MALLIPPGYTGVVPLTITNPSSTATLGGSTTTPVAASSTDYVVTCQLTGGQASAVYAGAQDQAAFTDVTAWWIDGSGVQHQLDLDYDTTSHGAWSAANVCVRFRLQAAIAALGSDAQYFLAFGSSTPTIKRNWANIYPFADAFVGPSLGAAWSSSLQPTTSLVVSNGLVLTVPAGAGLDNPSTVMTVSPYLFGAGHQIEMAAVQTPLSPLGYVGGGFGAGFNVPLSIVDTAGPGNTTSQVPVEMRVVTASAGTRNSVLYRPADSATHWWRVGLDAAGISYAYVDAYSASISTAPFTTAVPCFLMAWPQHPGNSLGATQLSVQWVKVRPWGGPSANYTVLVGAVTYRSGTVLTPTPSATPLVRAGSPSLVRGDATTWLALYSDGTHAQSRAGAGISALAAASNQQALASAAGVQGAAVLSAAAGTVVAVAAQTGGAPAVAVYSTSSGTWSAGTATGLPGGAVFAGDTYTSGGVTYWHLLSAAAGGTTITHRVATTAGGPWTAISSATVVALPSSDPCLAGAAYAGSLVACAINSGGYLTYATLDALDATGGGSTVSASTCAQAHGALRQSENLAFLNSLEGGAGDLYVAYNNNNGICVRTSPAGGPLSWSSEVQVSADAADTCPTLVRDGTGAVTLFWLGGASGNPLWAQRLQVVGGAVYLTGDTLMQTNYAAARSLLSCVPSEPSGLVGLCWLES